MAISIKTKIEPPMKFFRVTQSKIAPFAKRAINPLGSSSANANSVGSSRLTYFNPEKKSAPASSEEIRGRVILILNVALIRF